MPQRFGPNRGEPQQTGVWAKIREAVSSGFRKIPDKGLRKEFESPRGQWTFIVIGAVFLVVAVGAFLILFVDPFGWFDGPPAVGEAKKWLAICVCFMWIPAIAGVWFMVIKPLKSGVVTGGSKHRSPYIVFRSEAPARFRGHLIWNCILLIATFALATWCLVGLVRDLQKAKTAPAKKVAGPGR
jgi:hypothetical protein